MSTLSMIMEKGGCVTKRYDLEMIKRFGAVFT